MHNWLNEKAAGETEERIAEHWLHGIDFTHLSPVSWEPDKNGHIKRSTPPASQLWTR